MTDEPPPVHEKTVRRKTDNTQQVVELRTRKASLCMIVRVLETTHSHSWLTNCALSNSKLETGLAAKSTANFAKYKSVEQ